MPLINGIELSREPSTRLGAQFTDFDKFWSYARLLSRNAIAAALPSNL